MVIPFYSKLYIPGNAANLNVSDPMHVCTMLPNKFADLLFLFMRSDIIPNSTLIVYAMPNDLKHPANTLNRQPSLTILYQNTHVCRIQS